MKKKAVAYTLVAAFILASLSPATAFAAKCSNDKAVLLFPTWFHGLSCTKAADGTESVQINSINKIWVIVMNVVQWLIIAGGYVALYFILWSGFKFITANGDPSRITSAKNTILNAVIGLVIVLASVAIVRTIQAGVGGVVT